MRYKMLFGLMVVSLVFMSMGMNVIQAGGPGASWTKYKRIDINSSTGALTNYAVPINVTYDADMQSDFDDLRFYAEDDTTELDYWMEEKVDSQWAYVWVEVDTINSSIYMYYGNPSATSASNGENTFLFFDDFDDGSFDTTKWYEIKTDGSYSEANGYLKVTGGSGLWEAVGSKVQHYDGYSWRVRFNATAESDKWNVGIDDRSNNGSSNDADGLADITIIRYNGGKSYYSDAGDGSGQSVTRTSDFTSFKTADYMLNSTMVTVYEDGGFVFNSTDSPDTTVGMSFWVQNINLYVDWTFTRNWTDPEPTYSIGAEQSNAAADTTPPTITITSPANTTYSSDVININVTLNEDGDWCAYNFDGGTNYTLSNDSMTNWFIVNQTAIANGTTVHLFVYCNDTSGNMALNDSIWFTYEVQQDTGQPYLIQYSLWNLTTFAEDGINHIVYDDVNNDNKKEYLFLTEAVNTGNDPELVLYDPYTDTQTVIKSWTNYKRGLFINVLDYDSDGKNEIIFGLSGATGAGRIYVIEINESDDIVHEMYADGTNVADTHPKTRAWDDWDNDGYMEFFSSWCSNGNVYVMNCDNSTCSISDKANYGVTAEGNIGYDWDNDGKKEVIYLVGYSSSGATTITIRRGEIDTSLALTNVAILNQTTEYGTGSLSGSVGDLDGDGVPEFVVAYEEYGTDEWDIYSYEINSSGDIVDTYEIARDFKANRLFYTGEIFDHDGDGDYEYVITYSYGGKFYTHIFETDASHTITNFTAVTEPGNYGTNYHANFKPQVEPFGQFPVGIATLDGSTDGIAVVVNFTRPEITPHYPNVTAGDNLQLEFTCFDWGLNSTELTAYIEWYKDDALYTISSMTVSNATEYTTNISNSNIAIGEEWHARVWCDDGYSNSTKHNSTSVTVLGEPPDTTPPTVSFISPTATNGTEAENKNYILWNISVSEDAGLAKIEINGTNYTATCVNASSDTYCYYNDTGISSNITHCAVGHASDSSGNWGKTTTTVCRSTNIQTQQSQISDITVNVYDEDTLEELKMAEVQFIGESSAIKFIINKSYGSTVLGDGNELLTSDDYIVDGDFDTYVYHHGISGETSSYTTINGTISINNANDICVMYKCKTSTSCKNARYALELMDSGGSYRTIANRSMTEDELTILCDNITDTGYTFNDNTFFKINFTSRTTGTEGSAVYMYEIFVDYNNWTGQFIINSSLLEEGQNVIKVSHPQDEYYTRLYLETINQSSNMTINAYLPSVSETVSTNNFVIHDIYGTGIPNADVTVKKFIEGEYKTISEVLSDDSGLVSFNLIDGDYYKLEVVYGGLTHYSEFLAKGTTRYIMMNTTLDINFTYILDGIDMHIEPSIIEYNESLDEYNVTFSFEISDTDSNLTKYGMTLICNSSIIINISNVTGTHMSGGKVSYNFNVIGCDNITMYYYFTREGFDEWSSNTTWYPIKSHGYGLWQAFKMATENMEQGMITFVAIMIIVFTAAGVALFSPEIAAISELIVGGIFVAGGWLNVYMFMLLTVIVFSVLLIKRRYL